VLIGRGQILQDITNEYELDKMKSSLISTVSHELRTPLAAIKGYATTLLAKDVDWEQQAQEEFLEIISNEADRLSDLVSNLLDMSRIEAGSLKLSRTESDLQEIIERGVDRAYIQPVNKLDVIIPEELPPVYVDAQRIEVVIRNLVENAIKYSDNELPIKVMATKENGYILVSVEDQGPGIPVESQEDVFKSFYRLEDGQLRRKSGAGLGLAISRGFIQAHGGEIWIESMKGRTRVVFSLPTTAGNISEQQIHGKQVAPLE
jgi:signal transduction histidine kinase